METAENRKYPAIPRVAVGGVVVHKGRVLLIRRAKAPSCGLWAIPGGAVELTDELKAELREALENEKYNTAIDELTSAWYDEAEIVWTEEGQPWKIEDQEAAE